MYRLDGSNWCLKVMRKIIHCDADCFFAAIEMRDDPSLRNRPMAVGGSPQSRGVISTCNYEARRYGVRSAMASAHAQRLCPDLLIVPHRMDAYREASQALRQIFFQYTERVEPLSLDEAFLDVSDSEHCEGSATRIAQEVRSKVKAELGISVSAGVAPNKFLAKIASDWRKPDGLFVITPEQVTEFIRELSVAKIPGVGPVTKQKLSDLQLHTCADVQQLSRFDLHQHFGRFGEKLYDYSRGMDERPVQAHRRRKSVSVEETYTQDLISFDQWQQELSLLCDALSTRLQRIDHYYVVQGCTVKVRYHDFTIRTSDGPAGPIRASSFAPLLTSLWERRSDPIRLLGIGVRLRDEAISHQWDLFEEEKHQALLHQYR